MKSILIAAAATIGLAGAALAGGPVLMTDDQMDKVVAGVILPQLSVDTYGAGAVLLGGPNPVEKPDATAGDAMSFGLCSGGGNTAEPGQGCPL